MGKRVGIDLGTTNCVVTIAGDIGDYPKRNGATILPDGFARTIHASAICECDSEMIFGDDAKYKAAEGYTPHRFWKRYMGKDMKYTLRGKEVRPQDLSCELLLYLKSIAEKALGEPVESAVITHPAYFGAEAIAATREAGDMAGLNVGADGLMMEPIAAALAYLQDDPDPQAMRRVMVYDLGGGTFDITVLQRANGEYTPLSFDGDHELGGYNFDKALANHMLGQLRQQGYKIDIDPDAPERNAKWAALMHYAEEAKIALSAPLPKGIKTDVRVPTAFLDDAGKPVRLAMTITREQFEKLVEPLVDPTIEACKRALKKASLDMSKIDRAILVGGSSRLPIVQRKLKEEFARDFEIDEQMVDLCVAIGAALYAGRGDGKGSGGFRLDPRPPAKTKEEKLRIAGAVLPTAEVTNLADVVLELHHDDEQDIVTIGDDGLFVFDRELSPDGVNCFKLRATTIAGVLFAEHGFDVEHAYETAVTVQTDIGSEIGAIPTYLAKTIYVKTANVGLHPVAPEGPPLPVSVEVPLLSSDDGLPEITVELFQDDQPLVDMVLKGFSIPVPKDTPIKLTVNVGKDYSMDASAEIPSHNARVVVQKIKIPMPMKPTVSQLRQIAPSLRAKLGEKLANMPGGTTKMAFGAKCDEMLTEAEQLQQDAAPDVFRIERLLRNVERELEKAIGSGMDPSHPEMAEKFVEAHRLLQQAESKDAKLREEKMDKTLKVLQDRADQAYPKGDIRTWKNIAEQIDAICDRLKRTLEGGGGGGGGELPPAPVLKMYLMQLISEVRQEAVNKGKQGDRAVQQAISDAESQAQAVNVSSPSAQNDLIRIFQGPVKRAKDLIGMKDGASGSPNKASINLG